VERQTLLAQPHFRGQFTQLSDDEKLALKFSGG